MSLQHNRRMTFHTGVTRLGGGDELPVGHRCHVWACAWIVQCGDDSRPSRDEVVVLVYTMLETMLCAKKSTRDARRRGYNPELPVSLPFYPEMVALSDTDDDRHYSSSQISQAIAAFSVDIMTGNSMLV